MLTRRKKVEGSPDKISISRIKRDMEQVSYLSNELVITGLDSQNYQTIKQHPISVDGFVVIILMSGSARLYLNLNEYIIQPNDVVFFSPEAIVDLKECTDDAMAYVLAFSKKFVNEIQVDLAASLPIYMRFSSKPILHIEDQDVVEIRQLFQLMKTMLRSDKERYRHEIVRSLFTTAFYIITDLNQRERLSTGSRGRGEIIFEEFSALLQKYNKQERNVGFYADKLGITPKYLSSIIKEVSGKTAARWIDESVILEAKSLLKYSGMSIQEIATHLNFTSQSFFGKYFKQHTGISPSRFKRKG